MGWIGKEIKYYKPDGSTDLIMEAFDGKLSWESNSGCKYKVLKTSVVGNVIYAAIQMIVPNKDPVIHAAVILTKKYQDYIMVKHQMEAVGPCDYDCPASILKLLTPIEDAWAQEWRDKCRNKAARKRLLMRLQSGSRIEYAPGTELSQILVLAKFRNRRYWIVENMKSVYIKTSDILLNGFKILDEV